MRLVVGGLIGGVLPMVSPQLGLVEYSVHLLEHWEGLVAVVHRPIVAATAAEEARCVASAGKDE
jgi:hypothetical protein